MSINDEHRSLLITNITVTETIAKNGRRYYYKIMHEWSDRKVRISTAEFLEECCRPMESIKWIAQNLRGEISFSIPN